MKYLRSYLLAGLVVWIPVLVTIGILRFIVEIMDRSIALLPSAYQPAQLLGVNVPGFGVILSFATLLITGVAATNFLGQRLVLWSEKFLDKIPLVRTIYNASKQMIQAVVSTNSQAFRTAVIIEYPRKGLWSLGFQTGNASTEVKDLTGADMISVFIPTTPNPTSGFLLMVPRDEVTELKMSADEALKLVISLGVMQPNADQTAKLPPQPGQ